MYKPRRIYSHKAARLRYSVRAGEEAVAEVTNVIAAKKKELFKPIRDQFKAVTITVRQGDGRSLSVTNALRGMGSGDKGSYIVTSGAGMTRVTISSPAEQWKVTIATSYQNECKLYTGVTVLNDRPHAVMMDPLVADAVAECSSALKQIELLHDSEAARIAKDNGWQLEEMSSKNAWWKR